MDDGDRVWKRYASEIRAGADGLRRGRSVEFWDWLRAVSVILIAIGIPARVAAGDWLGITAAIGWGIGILGWLMGDRERRWKGGEGSADG